MIVHCAKALHWWDFDFDRVEAPALSTAGTRYVRRLTCGMPKIPLDVLWSPFYLYHSREDAKAGRRFGGTGFFVGYPTGVPERPVLLYAVTNWHVAVRDGASVMRVNTEGNNVDILEFDPSEWEFLPGGPDLAVISHERLDMKDDLHQIVALHLEMFVEREDIRTLQIGPGEDVFMVGRFVDYDGATVNKPAVRFGHISEMPEKMPQPTGADHLTSYVLDMHSRTGFSGSPVLVYRTHMADLTGPPGLITPGPGSHFLRLLGVHWGQFPELWEIEAGKKAHPEAVPISSDTRYIKGMSGMTMALPAWQLRDFLDMKVFAEPRARAIAQLRKALGRDGPPVAESASRSHDAGAENPRHKEDFSRLLNAAAKTKPQADQT